MIDHATEGTSIDPSGRAAKVRAAITGWKKQLLDISGRNALLYFKDQRLGTLDLSAASRTGLDRLLAREWMPLGSLIGIHGDDDMAKRARAIRKKALENYEERGIQTLFFTWGMASWLPEDETRRSPPRAPILLFPAELKASDAREEDHRLQLVGDPAINPTLVHFLTTTYGVTLAIDAVGTLPGIEGEIDTREEVSTILQWFADSVGTQVPEFAVADERTLANYSYQKMPMVEDLDAAEELLQASDLVAAIAGDREAQQALTESIADEPPPPDYIPPADEFLTQDADSTQNAAINAALAGRSVIIEGPPGTGKSQTIANLLGAFIARGKRALFVAEKRAAIDAVMSRLEHVGLAELVLDLHSGSRSKRAQVQALEELRDRHVSTTPVGQAYANDFVESRGRLVQNDEAMNAVREPWKVTLLDLYGEMVQLRGADPVRHRLIGSAIESISSDKLRGVIDAAASWAHAGGSSIPHGTSVWRDSVATSGTGAEACLDFAQRLGQSLIPDVLSELSAGCNAFSPDAHINLAHAIQLESLASRATALSAEVKPSIYGLDLPATLVTLAPAQKGRLARGFRTLTSATYRHAIRDAREHLIDHEAHAHAVYGQVAAAAALQAEWIAKGGAGVPQPAGNLDRMRAAISALEAAIAQAAVVLPSTSLDSRTLAELEVWAGAALAEREVALKIPIVRTAESTLRDAGFGPLLDELVSQRASGERAREAVRLCWIQSVLDHIVARDNRLQHLGREAQDAAATRYVQLDRRHIESTPMRIRRLAAVEAIRAEDQFRDEALALKAAVRRRQKIAPLREIFAASPHVITAWAPCWTMSPLLVSQMLPATGVSPFDVVIFDEASQVLPADAIPAIARARQAVVAGDRRQLPPTSFFATATDEDEDEQPDGSVDTSLVQGYESLLEVMGVFLASKDLMWHYRSADERLIAFSNVELYGRRLTTFPGIAHDDVIRHIVVDPSDAPSEQSARAEVEAVVRLILEHAEQRPERSLGVITMGTPHKLRIEEALRLARALRPELDGFFSDGDSLEPFFVKNLERVQGDERDCIILTIGYGKGPDGRIRYNFGPVNNQGGERRLNVAVTRAKHSVVLVSTFRGDELDEPKCQTTGMRLLREYALYAGRGGTLDRRAQQAAEINAFERDISDALLKRGMILQPQYGVSGYRIDFVVGHPSAPGRWVLAIECDGATYHSAQSARDRDRLRQEHLQRLGWKFHRIWSTEWFKDKPAEVERAWNALQAAIHSDGSGPEESERLAAPEAGPADEPVRAAHTRNEPRPRVPPGYTIDSYTDPELKRMLAWIKSDGRLRSEDELLAALMTELGFARRGSKIVERLTAAIRAHDRRGRR